jgi:hypothetical protein
MRYQNSKQSVSTHDLLSSLKAGGRRAWRGWLNWDVQWECILIHVGIRRFFRE